MKKDGYLFFYGGIYSQWFLSPFEVDGIKFPTAEHYMMYSKALLFKDEEAAAKILTTNDPKEAKAIGRNIKNFELYQWDLAKELIVYEGNYNKFKQNPDLLAQMEKDMFLTLVEASPSDTIWGIGLDIENPDITNPSKWKGENLLGRCIMTVRAELLKYKSNPLLKKYGLDTQTLKGNLIKQILIHKKLVIGFDFDNTVQCYKTKTMYHDVIGLLHKLKRKGHILCLWTANENIDQVVTQLEEVGIIPDYINESPLNTASRKAHFNVLLDDSAGLSEVYNTLKEIIEEY